jgi:hypothetical protein
MSQRGRIGFAAVVNLVKGRWPEHYCSIYNMKT